MIYNDADIIKLVPSFVPEIIQSYIHKTVAKFKDNEMQRRRRSKVQHKARRSMEAEYLQTWSRSDSLTTISVSMVARDVPSSELSVSNNRTYGLECRVHFFHSEKVVE